MRDVARRLEKMDPGGSEILTQDLYLAFEMGRRVPEGLEMGPFSYFPDISTAEAESINVMNTERLERLLQSAPCRLAVFSGYGFAISAPKCIETPREVQDKLRAILRNSYRKVDSVRRFGQNHTTMDCYIRMGDVK